MACGKGLGAALMDAEHARAILADAYVAFLM